MQLNSLLFFPFTATFSFVLLAYNPESVWVALLAGAVLGFAARILLDNSKEQPRPFKKIAFESLATVLLCTGCGMLVLESLFFYFAIKAKIESGEISPQLPIYLSSSFSCLITLGGREGLNFIWNTIKMIITKKIEDGSEK